MYLIVAWGLDNISSICMNFLKMKKKLGFSPVISSMFLPNLKNSWIFIYHLTYIFEKKVIILDLQKIA